MLKYNMNETHPMDNKIATSKVLISFLKDDSQ